MTFAALVCGCNSYESEFEAEVQHVAPKDDMLHFASKEMLLDAIENPMSNSVTRAMNNSNFRSLMDEVDISDPALSSLTLSDKVYIAENNLNYYEAFDYESLVPNDKFAQYLNHKAEICCNDTIYKITEYGTLAAHEDYQDELESVADILADIVSYNDNENEKQLSSNVRIINTFNRIRGDVNSDIDLGDRLDDGRDSGDTNFGNNGGNTSTSTVSYTNTSLSDIPFSTFPNFSSGSHTFVGHLLEGIFGERSTKHHEFISGYRVSGSLYDYDYGVYHECGVYVSMEKKRGGFFKAINGWKNINADELVMDLEGMVLALKVNIPANIATKMPTHATISGYDSQFKYWGKTTKCVNILGYDVKESDIYALAGKGLTEILNRLKTMCNHDVDADVKAAQIITPNKAYIVLLSHPIYAHNQHKIRKVFDSGVRIGITSSVVSNPTAPNSYAALFKFLQDMPRIEIAKGKVRLAGRYNSSWGGMKINK